MTFIVQHKVILQIPVLIYFGSVQTLTSENFSNTRPVSCLFEQM